MLTTLIGIIGATLILLAFLFEQTNVWKNSDLSYDLMNFIGSAFLVVYGVLIGAYPFVVLNSVWMIFSLRDVFLDLKIK